MFGFDTHIHSSASDGAFSPGRLVEMIKEKGLPGLSITDHDTVDGYAEAKKRAAELDVSFIPGIELSTELGERDVHVLGYWVDGEQLMATGRLQRLHQSRRQRIQEIVRKLNQLGMELNAEDIFSAAPAQRSLGRPHVAQAMITAGYVSNIREAFTKWLGRGKPAFVPREKMSPSEALSLIRQCGGVAALAHPGTGVPDSLIPALQQEGLGGIEVFHPEHNRMAEQKYLQIARKMKLAALGGSDFHVPGIRELGCRVSSISQLEILSRYRRD
ncbi:MAG: PHP domain-containing protein [Bacillota bacterium]|nr:PHP domain-containing protein [Bacillota bacterium]